MTWIRHIFILMFTMFIIGIDEQVVIMFLNTKRIGIVVLSGFLAACSDGSGDKNSSQDSVQAALINQTGTIDPVDDSDVGKQISIQGGAIKGVIENGVVRVFSVESKAGFYGKSTIPLGVAERTDENGQFNVSIPGASVDAIVVEITADINTRMTCDVVEGCGLDAQGELIAFGEKFPLNSDFILEAAYFGLQDKDALTLYVTPLTHLAVSYAVAQTDGLSADNISGAYSLVEETLNLSPGSLQLPPPDLTKLDAYESLSGDELQYAVMSASFLALVNMPDWGSIDEVLNSAADRFALSGGLPNENGGVVSEVTLDDLFYQASDIASDLQSETSSTQIIVELVSVESSTDMYYQEVSSLYVDELESVSGDADESEAVVTKPEVVVTEPEVVVTNPEVVVTKPEVVVTEPEVVVTEPEAEVITPIKSIAITSHPGSMTATVDSGVEFSVIVDGNGTIYYQWRKDGVDIDGENGSTLSIGNAQISDSGVYDVIVANDVGTVPSLGATLLVEPLLLTAQLTWTIPAKRQDGTDLLVSDVAGYILSYGTQPDGLMSEVVINGAEETVYTFENLDSKEIYYFKIATVDVSGIQGEFSELVTKSFM
jgi:Ig-like domain-containing protein